MQDRILPRRASASTESLPFLIGAVRSLMKQAIWPLLAPLGVTPQQLKILLVLDEGGELSLHELAESLWADDPTTSRVVRSLIRRGFVLGTPDPGHGRRMRLDLTSRGRRLAQRLRVVAERLGARIVEGLSPEERSELRRILRRIISNIQGLGPRELGLRPRKAAPRGGRGRRTPAKAEAPRPRLAVTPRIRLA